MTESSLDVKMPTKSEWLAEAKKGGNSGEQRIPSALPATWTLWDEATSMCAALTKASEHCRQTVAELQQRLIELDNMLGKMPKRP